MGVISQRVEILVLINYLNALVRVGISRTINLIMKDVVLLLTDTKEYAKIFPYERHLEVVSGEV